MIQVINCVFISFTVLVFHLPLTRAYEKVILVKPVSLNLESQRTKFSSGRTILPMEQELRNDTEFGFRYENINTFY